MRERKTIFKILEEKVPKEIKRKIKELKKEIEEFYNKLDILYHYQKNSYLFTAIYNKKLTNIEISNTLPIDIKSITKFFKKTEELIKDVIMIEAKYKSFRGYISIKEK